MVAVTHELARIFAIGDNSILLDGESRALIAHGNPKELGDHSEEPRVRRFLTRGDRQTGSVQDRG